MLMLKWALYQRQIIVKNAHQEKGDVRKRGIKPTFYAFPLQTLRDHMRALIYSINVCGSCCKYLRTFFPGGIVRYDGQILLIIVYCL